MNITGNLAVLKLNQSNIKKKSDPSKLNGAVLYCTRTETVLVRDAQIIGSIFGIGHISHKNAVSVSEWF